jgi:uncharacterized protein (DUF1015 family)
MLRIKAFQGLRPAPEHVEEVACVPYDVVNAAEAAALAAGKPRSLLHVDRAEIDLPPDTDPYSDVVYAKAREAFLAMQRDGTLIRESAPSLYLYQQRMGEHVQTGIVAVCHIDDYEQNVIKKHEKTRPDKEDDRTRLIGTLSADTGPVFLTYRNRPEIDAMAKKAEWSEPLYDFKAPDGVEHTLWRIARPEAFVHEFAQVPAAYVADGHHRTASAVRVGRERRAANPQHTGDEDYNWFLAVLFPASQLRILPYNRVVKDLNGLSKDDLIAGLEKSFAVTPRDFSQPREINDIMMYLEQQWYELAWQPALDTEMIASLDVSRLQDRVLGPLLGIDDPRTSKRIEFIGGIRGSEELQRLVDSGAAAVAFAMYPTSVEILMQVSDAGQIMPPKSTWFEPKLRSGLVIHTF